MKLRKILLFILLSAATSIFLIDNNTAQQSENNTSYESLEKRVSSLENINSKFSTEYLISHYSTSFDHMFTIQAMAIGLFGVISVIVSFATYFLGYRPMKEAEKKFNAIEGSVEEIVKKKFDSYIKEKEYSKMNEALHNLTSTDPVLRQSAINYIKANQDFILDDYHASLIYSSFDPYNNSEPTLRLPLETLLSSNDNIWAKKYFKKLFSIPEDCFPHTDYVLKYLSRYYSKEISDFILSFTKKRFEISNHNLNYIFELFSDSYNLPSILPDYVNDFLNNKEYIDLLDLTEPSRFKNIIISYSKKYPLQYENTYLFTKNND